MNVHSIYMPGCRSAAYIFLSSVWCSSFFSMNASMNTSMNTTLFKGPPYAVGYFFDFVITFGSLGNIFVIFTVWRHSLFNNRHYFLVFHLAICDLLTLLGNIGRFGNFTGIVLTNSFIACKLWFLLQAFFVAGVLFMVLTAILRYRAVFYPLRPAVSRLKLYFVSAAAYVVSFLCYIPYFLVLDFEPPNICFENWSSERLKASYDVFLSAVQFFIPVAFLGGTYWKICRQFVKQSKMIQRINASTALETNCSLIQRLAHHRNARTFAISFAIFVCFFNICLGSPQQIAYILSTFVVDVTSYNYYIWLLSLYYFGVSALNPLLYGILDRKFRSCYKFRLTVLEKV